MTDKLSIHSAVNDLFDKSKQLMKLADYLTYSNNKYAKTYIKINRLAKKYSSKVDNKDLCKFANEIIKELEKHNNDG